MLLLYVYFVGLLVYGALLGRDCLKINSKVSGGASFADCTLARFSLRPFRIME